MATHSSDLAWRMPGTAEPGGLPSMGSHRVGHDWSDLAAAAVAAPPGKPKTCGILVPWPRIEPGSRHWKCGVLTTRPPGNSVYSILFFLVCFLAQFVTILLLFYVVIFSIFWPWGMWNLSSSARDWTCAPCNGRQNFNHWTAREVPIQFLISVIFLFSFRMCFHLTLSWTDSSSWVIFSILSLHFFCVECINNNYLNFPIR